MQSPDTTAGCPAQVSPLPNLPEQNAPYLASVEPSAGLRSLRWPVRPFPNLHGRPLGARGNCVSKQEAPQQKDKDT